MRGHIVKPNPKRSNLWGFVVELPRDPMTQKRKQKWRSGFKTRREAERALADAVTRVDQSTYVEQSRMTLSAFLDEWLPSAYVLAATTGRRRGEVLGLRWQDVDLNAGRVSVSQTLVVVSGYDVQYSVPRGARSSGRLRTA